MTRRKIERQTSVSVFREVFTKQNASHIHCFYMISHRAHTFPRNRSRARSHERAAGWMDESWITREGSSRSYVTIPKPPRAPLSRCALSGARDAYAGFFPSGFLNETGRRTQGTRLYRSPQVIDPLIPEEFLERLTIGIFYESPMPICCVA